MADDFDARVDGCLKAIEAKYDADVLVYAGDIGRPHDDEVIDMVIEKKGHKNVLLFITTFGGDADAAFRIARALRSHYKKVTAVVSGYCKSAGTLLVLGADEVVMLGHAELGPLDVQLLNQNEWGEQSSGLAPTQALLYLNSNMAMSFEALFLHLRREMRLSTKIAGDLSRRMVSSVYSGVFDQLDPLRLGETQRATAIAVQYGRRLIAQSGITDESTLNRLVSGYPSHGFVIDLQEAKRLFGDKARAPYPEEQSLEELFHESLRAPVDKGRRPIIVLFTDGGATNEQQPTQEAGAPAPPPGAGGANGDNGPAPPGAGDGSVQPEPGHS